MVRKTQNFFIQNLKDQGAYLLLVIPLFFALVQTSLTQDAQFSVRLALCGLYLAFVGIFLLIRTKKTGLTLSFPAVMMGLLLIAQCVGILYTINPADAFMTCSLTCIFFLFLVLLPSIEFSVSRVIRVFSISVAWITLLMLLFGFYDLVSVIVHHGYSHEQVYRVRGTMGHKNLLNEYLLLLLPFNVFAGYYFKRTLRYVGIINASGIIALALFCLTRSVWVAAPAATTLTFVAWMWCNRARRSRKAVLSLLMSASGVLSIVGIVLLFFSESAIAKQLVALFNLQHGSVKDRLVLWGKTLTLWSESPITGKGTASWSIEFLQTGNEGLKSRNNVIFYQRPHNDWLWLLFENGAAVLFRLGAVLYIFRELALRLKNRCKFAEESWFYFAVFFSLSAYFFIEQFSFPAERPAFVSFIALLWVLTIINEKRRIGEGTKQDYSKFGLAAAVILAIIVLVLSIMRFKSEVSFNRAMQFRARGYGEKVIEHINKAENRFFKVDAFSTPLRWYSATAYFESGMRERACSDFEKALNLNPYHVYILNDMGTCMGLKVDFDSAAVFYKQSLKIAPNFGETLYNISALYFNEGKTDSAVFYLRKINPEQDPVRYSQYIEAIVKPVIQQLIRETESDEVKNELTNLYHNEEWITAVLRKAEDAEKSIDQSIMENVLFVLKKEHYF